MNGLVYDHDLHLVGANWMKLTLDATFPWNLKEMDMSEAEACKKTYPSLKVQDGELQCPESRSFTT